MSLDIAREAVAAAGRALADAGLVIGTAGNVSVAVGEAIAITASGAAFATIAPDDVTVVDRSGALIAGELAPSSELELHLGAYRRYGVRAAVHTHAPMATAVACVVDELPCVHYQMLPLGGAVRVAPYRTFGSAELAEVTLDALDGRAAALMSNHGAITVADNLAEAVERALLLEWACTLYWRAAQLGTPRVLDEAQQAAAARALSARGDGTRRGEPGKTAAAPARELRA
jgi:L-fuculose-phosphate aldolase